MLQFSPPGSVDPTHTNGGDSRRKKCRIFVHLVNNLLVQRKKILDIYTEVNVAGRSFETVALPAVVADTPQQPAKEHLVGASSEGGASPEGGASSSSSAGVLSAAAGGAAAKEGGTSTNGNAPTTTPSKPPPRPSLLQGVRNVAGTLLSSLQNSTGRTESVHFEEEFSVDFMQLPLPIEFVVRALDPVEANPIYAVAK